MERAYTEPFTIGRGMQATLHVDSGRVSRLHAEVVFEDGGWVLRDAGSTNGTYHNDQRVERVPLGSGETAVRLGREGPFVYLAIASDESASNEAGRPAGATVPVARRQFAEEDTQRQSQPYRPRPTEEPTAWHSVPEVSQTGGTGSVPAGVGQRREESVAAQPAYGKIALAVVLVLLLIALVFVLI